MIVIYFSSLLQAFITASRQHAARNMQVGVDIVVPQLTFCSTGQSGNTHIGYILKGLALVGGAWDESTGNLVSSSQRMKGTGELVGLLRWVSSFDVSQSSSSDDFLEVPIYLNDERLEMLMTVWMNKPNETKKGLLQHDIQLIA